MSFHEKHNNIITRLYYTIGDRGRVFNKTTLSFRQPSTIIAKRHMTIFFTLQILITVSAPWLGWVTAPFQDTTKYLYFFFFCSYTNINSCIHSCSLSMDRTFIIGNWCRAYYIIILVNSICLHYRLTKIIITFEGFSGYLI